MAVIGLVIREPRARILTLANELVHWAKSHKHGLLCEQRTAVFLDAPESGVLASELIEMADPIVTLGGDGTMIGIARLANEKSPILLGVNFGHLGFLTEIAPTELISTVDSVLRGTAKLGRREMLQVEVLRDNKSVFSSQAVNDVVIEKGAREKLVDLDVYMNDEEIMRVRADGVIFATPTGSTAYSLAAGGSITYPTLSVMLLTPICPHSLTNRPLLLPLNSELSVRIPKFDGEVFASADGQASFALKAGDKVCVTKAAHSVRFVRSSSKSYFDILRNKLNWGIPNKPD